jgi:murein DD-endopeptidase MepM/ murein hydrolase activator NlpD
MAVETILELNDITDSDKLTPGQVLVLSTEEMTLAPSTAATAAATSAEAEETMIYTVASGDSPYGIARRFGIRVKTLMDLNDISDPGHLRPGQVLLLSAAATPPPATTPKATAPAKAAAAESTTHVVEQGENPYRVARRFGISVNALMTVNHITDPGNLRVGQQLVIPPPDTTPTPLPAAPIATSLAAPTGEATTYIVQAGDIPYRIARRFNISVHALMTANSITDPGDLQIGQQLVIPPPGTTPTPPAKLPNVVGAVPDNHQFIWPLQSRDLSQHYRSGHGGIDIRSPVGSAVAAAATGTVEFAGWNAAGYGYLVVLDHGNDFRTLYAHNSSVKVEVGQRVAQGDLISLSGSTGYSSGPHLHFEIILDYRPINPCSYLPGGC